MHVRKSDSILVRIISLEKPMSEGKLYKNENNPQHFKQNVNVLLQYQSTTNYLDLLSVFNGIGTNNII